MMTHRCLVYRRACAENNNWAFITHIHTHKTHDTSWHIVYILQHAIDTMRLRSKVHSRPPVLQFVSFLCPSISCRSQYTRLCRMYMYMYTLCLIHRKFRKYNCSREPVIAITRKNRGISWWFPNHYYAHELI